VNNNDGDGDGDRVDVDVIQFNLITSSRKQLSLTFGGHAHMGELMGDLIGGQNLVVVIHGTAPYLLLYSYGRLGRDILIFIYGIAVNMKVVCGHSVCMESSIYKYS
jgi:hypothetical protein